MQRSVWFILLMMVAAVCGCSQPAAEQPPAGEVPAPAEHPEPQPSQPAETASVTATAPPPATEAQVKFDPPYKSRVNIFLPPNRKHAVKHNNNSEIQLRGFVNVDQPKALLVVDGKLQALAAGERRGDLEVIQIDRPLVTLQRGRVRWTETLYPEG